MPRSNFLQDLLGTVFDRSNVIRSSDDRRPINELCEALLSNRGEVSAKTIGTALLSRYESLENNEKAAFFQHLTDELDVDAEAIANAADTYGEDRSPKNLDALLQVSEPKRQELLRRLNQGSDATSRIVAMRKDLLSQLRKEPAFKRADLDFQHLLSSWFNRGFLVLRRISWQTPANILEKIIAYEAVHAINDWVELRARLEPEDRRCFAFFHPSMPDEPLVFVEVALTKGVPTSIQSVLSQDRPALAGEAADTAVFYSISNCQQGLKGISFGNSLIKQVASDLSIALPGLKTFVTLSPVPGFAKWAKEQAKENASHPAMQLGQNNEDRNELAAQLASYYLTKVKRHDGFPMDSVARFHLGNGAELHAAHPNADLSENGQEQSYGVMVNYLYRLNKVEANHQEFAEFNTIAQSSTISSMAQKAEKLISQNNNQPSHSDDQPTRRHANG
ncbi:MAG: malonyl-CoA decarboxylase [Hyphomicrobiales bacterium]